MSVSSYPLVGTSLSVGSSSSGSNGEWKNWMAFHCNQKVVVDDVVEIGKVIWVQFSDNHNTFNVLARGILKEMKHSIGEVEKLERGSVEEACGAGKRV